ncbi:MAG: DUF167 domain-containing protein [Phycisphaerales bacterium]
MGTWCIADGDSLLLRVKAVPGASRDQIAGVLAMPDGERLKVRVAAPPEGGKANDAICRLVAKALGVASRDVQLESGTTNPEKTLRVRGVSADTALAKLASR